MSTAIKDTPMPRGKAKPPGADDGDKTTTKITKRLSRMIRRVCEHRGEDIFEWVNRHLFPPADKAYREIIAEEAKRLEKE